MRGRACRAGAGALRLEQYQRGAEHEQGHAGPQGAVGQQIAAQGRQAGVRFGGREVARHARQRAHAERVEQRRQPVVADVARKGAGHDPQHEKAEHAEVHHHHRAGGGGQQHQQGADEQQVGHDDDGQLPQVGMAGEGADPLRVHPWHQGAEHHAGGNQRKNEQAGHHAGAEAPDQVVALAHRGGEQHVRHAEVGVVQHRAGDENGDDEHRQRAEGAQQLGDHDRRIAIDVADRAADLHRVAGGCAKGHGRQQQRAHPQQGLAQLVIDVKLEKFSPHGALLKPLPRPGAAPAWAPRCAGGGSKRLPGRVRPGESRRRAGVRSTH